MKKCQKCHYVGNGLTTLQTVLVRGKRYKYYICRPCNAEKMRRYHATLKGRAYLQKRNAAAYAKDPQRIKARGIASKIPLQPCEACGAKNTHRHHDDYNKPLEVRFLCPLHHRQLHLNRMVLK